MTSQPAMLDAAAFALLQSLTAAADAPGPRARAAVDGAVHALHLLLRPRLRALIRAHGLADHAEDAEQACLIAMVDAARCWDPARSGFGTWLGWRWRSALTALARQLLGDRRTAAGQRQRAMAWCNDDVLLMLADPLAEAAVTRAAADWMEGRCADQALGASGRKPSAGRGTRGLKAALRRATVH